jgi:Metallopeptidase family M81
MDQRPIRVAVLLFSHETVTFLSNDTTRDDFIYPGSPAAGEALLNCDPRSYMGGFVKVAREFPGVELIGIESPLFPKTGTGSGWITQDAYETFAGTMLTALAAGGPFDGVYLCLHGAMGVRGVPRPEAELAHRGRARRSHRRHLRSARQRGRGFPPPCRPGLHRQVLPAPRQLSAGRARRAHPGACGPRRLPPGACDRARADHLTNRGAMDRRVAVDGSGAARVDLGGARARRLCERLLRLPMGPTCRMPA